jgi:tetratricopeptide (TPR) repeat protein
VAGAAGGVSPLAWPGAAAAYGARAAPRPGDSLVWQRLGEARVALGEWRPAAEAFEKALSLGSPNRGMVSVSLAKAYARLGDADKALAALEGVRQFLRFFVADLRTDPAFASLRSDPRFALLVPAQ